MTKVADLLAKYTSQAQLNQYAERNGFTNVLTYVTDITNIPDDAINVVFEQGKAFTVDAPITLPATVKRIYGNNATITYTKAQIDINDNSESCLNIEGNDGLEISDLKLVYTGTFDLGSSYAGVISGIRVINSDYVKITNVEVTGFNYTGIIVAGDKPYVDIAYCNNVTIEKCNLHHNRVSGVSYGNTDGLKIINNVLSYNGLSTDSGTGYGCAGMSTLSPKNTQVIGNTASYNIRKGLDAHSGYNGTFKDNNVVGNGLYGIYLDGNGDIGTWEIENNTISDMILDGSIPNFTTGYGIYVGSYDGQGTDNVKTNIRLKNNKIVDCNIINAGFFAPLYILPHGLSYGYIDIIDNYINCEDISTFMTMRNTATDAGNYYDIRIEGNEFIAASLSTLGFYVSSVKCRNLNFNLNTVEIATEYTGVSLVSVSTPSASDYTKTFIGNNLTFAKTGAWATGYIPFLLVGNDKENASDNTLNGAKIRDWNGYGFVDYGTAAPIAETYFKNSIRYNTNATASGFIGWVCTANGTPGTWKTFGAISA
jgi:hypothetical protein